MKSKGKIIISLTILVISIFIITKIWAAREIVYEDIKTFLEVLFYIKNAFIEKNIDNTKLQYEAIKGMIKGLNDPYSRFLDPKAFKTFSEDIKGTFYGVGMRLEQKDDKIFVVTPIEGTPAHKAGIKPGDQIIAVDDQSVEGKTIDEVVSMIRGELGKKVKIKIYRESEKKIYEFELIRVKIEAPVVEDKILKDNIGYIRFYEFTQNSPEKLRASIEKMKRNNISGLILDLRNNPGGDLRSAVEIASFFISNRDQVQTVIRDKNNKIIGNFLSKGVIVYREDRDANRWGEYATGNLIWEKPLVVLVNRYSASASEILSGAIKDYQKGVLVGEKTFGKGVVQSIFSLSDGSALIITTERYLLPSGRSIHNEGIVPDYIVEMAPENVGKERDIQLDKAIEVLKLQIALSNKKLQEGKKVTIKG
ncbi:MAG: S41 family peptidase [Dictyoglomaceae bacterium]|nr:S41 family peptidase [Dictyoglomaceae bacterium]